MLDIKGKLEAGDVNAAELKAVLQNLFCEYYRDVETHQKEVDAVERGVPHYIETVECAENTTPRWGELNSAEPRLSSTQTPRNPSQKCGPMPQDMILRIILKKIKPQGTRC